MREIMKILPVPVDGKSMDFRLTKLDAFSGAALLRMLSGTPKDPGNDSVLGLITSLSEADLRSLMTTCLQGKVFAFLLRRMAKAARRMPCGKKNRPGDRIRSPGLPRYSVFSGSSGFTSMAGISSSGFASLSSFSFPTGHSSG